MAEEKKEPFFMKAKFWSLIGKVTGLTVIVGGFILKWLGKLPGATSSEIMTCGLGCMAVFGTVDINLVVDKLIHRGV